MSDRKVLFKYCPMCRYRLKWVRVSGNRRLKCLKCGWVHYQNPLPAVVCLAENKKGQILIVKRGVMPHEERWALPGGFIELQETPEQACLRELKEETGAEGKIIKTIGDYIQDSKTYGPILVIGYEVKLSRELLVPGDDAKEVRFVAKEELPNIPFSSHRRIIADGYSNRSNCKVK